MSPIWQVVGLGLWFGGVFFSSRPLYHAYLRYGVPWLMHRRGISLHALTYSFDRMVYVVPVPNHDPWVLEATPADLAVELQVAGYLFPQLQGARLVLRMPGGAGRPLAFMAVAQMSSPMLDQAQLEGRIDARDYGLICASQLVQPSTLLAMRDEALLQLRHPGRYV